MRFPLIAALLSTAIIVPNAAQAAEFKPELSGNVAIEIQNDWAVDSDDPDAEVNTLFTKTEAEWKLSLIDRLAIEGLLVFEPVQDTDPGDDTEFENEGLYAEQLKFTYTGENYGLYAGKFGPAFGTAWDMAPDIYGPDFAEDYELTERIGFGGSYTLAPENLGSHTINASTFFADTSFLSDSIITSRNELDKEDGGISNTEDFSSYALSYDTADLMGITGLTTHLGYRNQAPGDADTDFDREKGYAVGASYTHTCTENIEAMALVEWVGLRNADGTQDDMDYLTTSLALNLYKNWSVTASYTGRDTDVDGGDDVDDELYQLSAGYTFDNGIGVNLGYRGTEEAEVQTDILGAFLTYNFEF